MDMIDLATMLNGINVILLFVLLSIYVKSYRRMKSKFCIGLVAFAFLFLVRNLVAMYLQLSLHPLYNLKYACGDYAVIIHLLETLGFGALVYVSWDPCGKSGK